MHLRTYLEVRGRASKLASALGVHVSTVTRIAKGEIDPSSTMILRICEASGGDIQPSDFFNSDQDA